MTKIAIIHQSSAQHTARLTNEVIITKVQEQDQATVSHTNLTTCASITQSTTQTYSVWVSLTPSYSIPFVPNPVLLSSHRAAQQSEVPGSEPQLS